MIELEVGYAVAFLGLLVALADWRAGAYLVPLAGVVQDPLRKIAPAEPVALVLLSAVFFAASVAGLLVQRGRIGFGAFLGLFPALRGPMQVFLLLFAAHVAATLLRYRSPELVGLGLISYLVPLLAVLFGYQFASTPGTGARSVRRFLLWYALLVVAGASGIYLDFIGIDSPLLRQVGRGIMIYDLGTVLKPYCGFFRAPEIAAWHAGAAICVLAALAFSAGGVARRALLLVGVPLLLGAATLTGRRKAVMLVVIFASVYGFLSVRGGRRSRMAAAALLLAGVVAGLAVGDFFDFRSPDERMALYMRRAGSVFADAPERFQLLGIGSVSWALERHGLLGAGMGVLSQGSQYVGGGAGVFGGSGEGGLGKITAELGLPGLLLFVWFLAAAGRETWLMLKRAQRLPPPDRALFNGLLALLVANVPGFLVASQAYSDPFIVITLGLLGGFVAAAGAPAPAPAPEAKAVEAGRGRGNAPPHWSARVWGASR